MAIAPIERRGPLGPNADHFPRCGDPVPPPGHDKTFVDVFHFVNLSSHYPTSNLRRSRTGDPVPPPAWDSLVAATPEEKAKRKEKVVTIQSILDSLDDVSEKLRTSSRHRGPEF